MSDDLQRAISLIQGGYIQEGAELLEELVRVEPDNEMAWWWLSAAFEDNHQRQYYLGQVLRINPHNHQARENLRQLQWEQANDSRPIQTDRPVATTPAGRPEQSIARIPASRAPQRDHSDFQNPFEGVRDTYETIAGKIDEALGETKNLVKHLVLTAIVTTLMSCICSWYIPTSLELIVPTPNNRPPTETQPNEAQPNETQPDDITLTVNKALNTALSWVGYAIPFSIILYFSIGYSLNGTWPHLRQVGRLLDRILGRKRTRRRDISLTVIGTLTLQLFILPGVSLRLLAPLLADRPIELSAYLNSTVDWAVTTLLFFVFFYYMIAYVNNWQITNNTSHYLLDYQADEIRGVYQYVLERMDQREIPIPYQAEFVTFSEGNLMSTITEDTETTQLQLTRNKARVTLRVLQYGNDLYIRWDSYLDLSARRIWLLVGLVISIINNILRFFIKESTYGILATLWGILWGKGFKSQGGQAVASSTIISPAYVDWSFISSYMLDDLYALEDAVNGSAEEVLNDLVARAGRSEKITLFIERSRNTQNRVF